MIDVEPHRDAYLAALHSGERREAIDVALALLQNGVSAEQVVTELLAPAQAEVGLGWQEGRWSVAMEHRASGITESALQAVVYRALSAPGAIHEGSLGHVVIACSESEWHVLPGRMAAEFLRLRGADVTFVGPSVPADELGGFLGGAPPAVVAVTCSMPMSLVGAWRSISSLRAIGMSVVCGGRGFGTDGRWGLALGADLWAPDFAAGADMLLSLADGPAPAPREPAGAPGRIGEVRVLARDHDTLVEGASQIAFSRWPGMRHSDAALRATRDDLSFTLKVIASATLVDDLALVTDHVRWFEAVLAGHGLPLAFVPSAFELLLSVLPTDLTFSRDAARWGSQVCSESSLRSDYFS